MVFLRFTSPNTERHRGAVVKELLAGADEIGSPAAIEAVFCVSICNFFFLLIVFV